MKNRIASIVSAILWLVFSAVVVFGQEQDERLIPGTTISRQLPPEVAIARVREAAGIPQPQYGAGQPMANAPVSLPAALPQFKAGNGVLREVSNSAGIFSQAMTEIDYILVGNEVPMGGATIVFIQTNSAGESSSLRGYELSPLNGPMCSGCSYGFWAWMGSLDTLPRGITTFSAITIVGKEVTQVDAQVTSEPQFNRLTPFLKQAGYAWPFGVIYLDADNLTSENAQILIGCCSYVSPKAIMYRYRGLSGIAIDPSLDTKTFLGLNGKYFLTMKQGGKCASREIWYEPLSSGKGSPEMPKN
jgi:hypothetical protein